MPETPDHLKRRIGDHIAVLSEAGDHESASLLTDAQRAIRELQAALQPLGEIGACFYTNSLDEARPSYGHTDQSDVELLSGRGGKRLLTLADAIRAHHVLDGRA